MDTLYVEHNEFNPDQMIKTALESKQSKPRIDPANPAAGAQSVAYQLFTLMYEYVVPNKDGTTTKVVAPLSVQAPEIYSPQGIMTKINPQGFETASIFVMFDMTKPDVKAFCSLGPEHTGIEAGFFQKLYRWCIDRVWELRAQIPSVARNIPTKAALVGMFAYPLHYARDVTSGEVIPGSNPSKYFNLLSRGKRGSVMRKETQFKAPIVKGEVAGKKEYETYKWEMLESAAILMRPIISFKQVYIGGGKVVLQMEITSAVVLDAQPVGTKSIQDAALASYANDADVHARVTAQFEALTRRLVDSRSDGTSAPALAVPVPVAAAAAAAAAEPTEATKPTPTPSLLPLPTDAAPAPGSPEVRPLPTVPPALPVAQASHPFAVSGLKPVSAAPGLASMMAGSMPTLASS